MQYIASIAPGRSGMAPEDMAVWQARSRLSANCHASQSTSNLQVSHLVVLPVTRPSPAATPSHTFALIMAIAPSSSALGMSGAAEPAHASTSASAAASTSGSKSSGTTSPEADEFDIVGAYERALQDDKVCLESCGVVLN